LISSCDILLIIEYIIQSIDWIIFYLGITYYLKNHDFIFNQYQLIKQIITAIIESYTPTCIFLGKRLIWEINYSDFKKIFIFKES